MQTRKYRITLIVLGALYLIGVSLSSVLMKPLGPDMDPIVKSVLDILVTFSVSLIVFFRAARIGLSRNWALFMFVVLLAGCASMLQPDLIRMVHTADTPWLVLPAFGFLLFLALPLEDTYSDSLGASLTGWGAASLGVIFTVLSFPTALSVIPVLFLPFSELASDLFEASRDALAVEKPIRDFVHGLGLDWSTFGYGMGGLMLALLAGNVSLRGVSEPADDYAPPLPPPHMSQTGQSPYDYRPPDPRDFQKNYKGY